MSEPSSAERDREGQRSLLEKVLTVITDVRPGEGVTVVLMALNLFLVLTAYYMLKTIREALILTEGGAAVKTYSSAGQAVLLLFLVPAFGILASRVNRVMLLRAVTFFFVANIIIFFLAGVGGLHVGVPLFIWVGIFNVMTRSSCARATCSPRASCSWASGSPSPSPPSRP